MAEEVISFINLDEARDWLIEETNQNVLMSK